MELARLFTEGVCAQAKKDSGLDLRLAGRIESVILDDVVELRYAMPLKQRRFLAALEDKSSPAAQAINQCADFWSHRKMHWKLLGDGPGFAITQYGRILVARLCGKATEGDYIENYKHKDTSTEAFAILLTANLRGTGDNYNLDVLSELEKWRAHESFVVIVCTEGDHRFDSFGIAQTDATGEVIKKRSAFPVVSVPQTSERFSGFLLGAATDAIIEAIASKMEGRASQIRNARSALVDFVDPRTATADMLVKRNFIVTLSDQCGPIVADMLKGMYNAYLPTDLTSRFIGLYTLLTGTMATEDAESYVGKDYANVGGIEAAYRDFCDLLGRMADTMSMRPAPEEPPSAPAAGVPRVGGPAAPAAPQLRAPALPVPAEPAPAPKQGSLPPVLSRALLNYNKEAARRLSREKIEMLAARGVIFKGDRDFIFIGPEVNEENIEPTAVIREGSILIGEHTHIGAKADIQGVVIDSTLAQSAVVAGDAVVISSNIDEHARIMRTGRRDSEMACMVFESSVGKGAEITDSVVTTQDFDGKKPETWAYDGNHKVTAQRTVIGAGSKVICSYLQNSGIGESCVLEWDDMESCRVGRDSKLSRLKSKLTRYGRKFIVDGRYRDGRPAPNEIQEAWMPSCVSILGAEGYYEGVFLSHFPAEDGTVHPLAFGPISCDRAVFSSFTGAGKTKGGEVVDSLDDPAVTSSQHNHMMTYPLLWPSRFKGMGSRLNVVGQPDYVSVNKTAPIGITALLPLSMPGAKPWTSVWGPVSGERSSPYWEDEEPISQFYLFPYLTADRLMELLQITAANQDAIADDIKEEGLTINTDRRNAINHLLLARADLFQKILDNAARVGLDEKDDIQRRFEQAISIARAQAQSGLWEIGDDGQLIHWTRDEAGQPVLRDDEATRAIVAELVAEDHMLEPSKWPTEDTIIQTEYDDPANRIPIDAEIFKEEEAAPAPQREMHPLPRRLTGFSNLFVHPSVLISDNVVVRNGTPGRPTIIWPGVTLRSGEVGSGAELFGVTGANIKIGEGTRCSSLRAETSSGSDINIGSDSFFAFQRIEANNGRSLRVGRDVTGRHACIVNEPVGDDTILYPGARLQDGYTGPRCKIGCPKIKVIGNPDGTGCDGVTAQHMASRLNHGSMLSKRTIHGGNIAAGGYAEEFRLERGVFWGTNRIGGPGITIGALSYVLADVPPDTTLRPFTVFQFRPKRDDPINLAGMLYGGSPSAISIGLRMGFGYPRRYATDAGQYEAVETEFERDECVLLAMLAGDLRLLGQQKMGQVPAEIEGLIKEVSAAVDYMRKDFEAAAGFPKDKARIIERAAAFQRLIEVAIPSVRQTLYARDDKAIMSILDAMAQTGMCLKNGSYRVRGGKFTDIRLHNHSTRPGWPRWDVQFKDPAPSTAIPITATAGTSGAAKAAVAGI